MTMRRAKRAGHPLSSDAPFFNDCCQCRPVAAHIAGLRRAPCPQLGPGDYLRRLAGRRRRRCRPDPGSRRRSPGILPPRGCGRPGFLGAQLEGRPGGGNHRRLADDFSHKGPSLAIGGGSAGAHTNGLSNLEAIYALNYLVGAVGARGGIRFNPGSPLDGVPASPKWPHSTNGTRSSGILTLATPVC